MNARDKELEVIATDAVSLRCGSTGCINCIKAAVKKAYELGEKSRESKND